MSLQCQKIEIKKQPFLASDITNFTSAVCAVVIEMSGSGEPLFESWSNAYSADLYSSYTTVYNYSANWGTGGDFNVNTFVYNTSASILSVNSVVNNNSANWNSVYSAFNSVSGDLLTFQDSDSRYVKLSGDVMFGGLSSPSISADTLYIGNSTINFFNENFQVVETLKGSDVSKFKSNYNTVNSKSANWEKVYTTVETNSSEWNYQGNDIKALTSNWENTYTYFNTQSANNASVYNTVISNSATTWNYQGNDIKALSSNWQTTYNNFSVQSANNVSVYNNVNSNSSNWNYAYNTILTGGIIGGNVSISGNISAWTADINYIDFNSTIDAPPYQEGRLFYDNVDNVLSFYVDNPDVTLNIGQEMWVVGVNKTGIVIPNGTVVYLSGAQGNRPKMWPALANSDLKSADTIGVTTHEVDINEEGYITTEGIVNSINTSSFNSGEVLYLSPTTPGAITNIKPVAPQHLVKIGYSLNSQNNGKIFVTVDNGYELDELHNIRITNPQNNEILSYNSISSLWINTSAYNGTDIKSLTSNWENTYTNFSIQSGNNLSVYSTVQTNSATWGTGGGGGSGLYLPLSGGTMDNGAIISFDNYSRIRQNPNGTENGIDLVCSIDYVHRWKDGFLYIYDQSNQIRTVYYGRDLIPNVNYDSSQGYIVGSIYVQDNGNSYICIDNSVGAAVWEIWNTVGDYLPLSGGTLTGALSTTDILYTSGGDSNQWNSTYTNFSFQSANNISVYSTVASNSATWGSGSGVSYLSALNDVSIPNPINGQVLTYSSVLNKWTTGTPVSATGATGYYGFFYDESNQTATSTTSAYTVSLTGTAESNGVSLSSNSVVFQYPGTYQIVYSIQVVNSAAFQEDIQVWFTRNGANIPRSTAVFTVNAKSGSTTGKVAMVTPFIATTVNGGDAIGLKWNVTNSSVTIQSLSANTTPSTPTSPGVIVAVQQVTNVQVPESTTGSYLPLSGGTLTGVLSTNNLIYYSNGNSLQWNETYTNFSSQSANNSSVYSIVQTNSAITWNYQGTDIKSLTSNWENTYNSFFIQSANNTSVYNTVQTNSSTTWNYQGTDVKILTANWENTYTTVQTNSTQWAVDNSIDVGVRSLTSNWQDTYTNFSTQSANNLSVYNTVQTYSATTWNPAGNYLPLSGGLITGNLNIFGNLSCNGTQTFNNTIFSTTSAVSVVHVGDGPALWVGNNGTGDIASFYDIDQNIEILHVGGNNGSFPNVGVKTSSPNVDFTVNGAISASSIIYDGSGNSNQWNDTRNTVQTNSGSWGGGGGSFSVENANTIIGLSMFL